MRLRKELGRVGFYRRLVEESDQDGFAELRRELVGDLEGDVLEIGTGTGATHKYYGKGAKVTAIEPDDEFRAAAEESAKAAEAEIRVAAGVGESLSAESASVGAVVASTVLCSVDSIPKALAEFRRVLRPGGRLRLLEHVRSEHWAAGPLMHLFNPIWRLMNGVGCNMNRDSVRAVRAAGFKVLEIKSYKIYCKIVPAAMPLRLIKAEM